MTSGDIYCPFDNLNIDCTLSIILKAFPCSGIIIATSPVWNYPSSSKQLFVSCFKLKYPLNKIGPLTHNSPLGLQLPVSGSTSVELYSEKGKSINFNSAEYPGPPKCSVSKSYVFV